MIEQGKDFTSYKYTQTVPAEEAQKVLNALSATGLFSSLRLVDGVVIVALSADELTQDQLVDAEEAIANELMDYFAAEIPYDILTGDWGDPIEWICNRLD